MRTRSASLHWAIKLAAAAVIGALIWHYWPVSTVESATTADGSQIKFRTQEDRIEIYADGAWSPFFVKGVNVGAALPGEDPGELPITKQKYLEWFRLISDMGANTIRIYTILPPWFYEALVEYNQKHPERPLYFIQGIWSPEEALIEKQDAYLEEIYVEFQGEISYAVGAVYGTAEIPERFGKAGGSYRANAAPYLLAWHIGTEWDPAMVRNTNELHKDNIGYQGTHISSKPEANPFENWLAEMLDHLAVQEAQHGWKHPLTFTNWVTTDPLSHPGEVLIEEDMASVDALHLSVHDWPAGYFAAYHAYPYYPDFFRLDESVRDVKDEDGEINTYRSYLRKLKEHHQGIPLMITEFGVPSSLGVAHLGNKNRNQGGHNETEQGQIDVSLLDDIHREGLAGAIVFSWQDEWFKRTWNTMAFEMPPARRKLWHNVLTNEQHFGLLAMLAGKEGVLTINGSGNDWEALDESEKQRLKGDYPGWKDIWVTHDEAYVYIKAELEQPFDPQREQLYIGADTIPGGNRHGKELGGRTLDEGLETLVVLGNDQESEVRIASNYDFHKRLYGHQYGMLEVKPEEMKDDSGIFNPWKLAVGLELIPPDSKKYHPFEDVPADKLARGTTDPSSPEFNSLAMWQLQGTTLELRIPWMLLGFTDPSSLHVMSYGKTAGAPLEAVETEGIRFVPWIVRDGQVIGLGRETGGAAPPEAPYRVSELPYYRWEPWDEVKYQERPKQSYYAMKAAFERLKE